MFILYALRVTCANDMQSPASLRDAIWTLRIMTRNARANRDGVTFTKVKAAANELSDRLKVTPTLSA
jgi:hypothetical protein